MFLSLNNNQNSFKPSKYLNTENFLLYPSLKNSLKNNTTNYNRGKMIFEYSKKNNYSKNINTFSVKHKKSKSNKNPFLTISSRNKNPLYNNSNSEAIFNSIKNQNIPKFDTNIFSGDLKRKIYVNDVMKSCYNVTKLNLPDMKRTKSYVVRKINFKNQYIRDVFKNKSNYISYYNNKSKPFDENNNYFVDKKYNSIYQNDTIVPNDKSKIKKFKVKQKSDSIIKSHDKMKLNSDVNMFRNFQNYINHTQH